MSEEETFVAIPLTPTQQRKKILDILDIMLSALKKREAKTTKDRLEQASNVAACTNAILYVMKNMNGWFGNYQVSSQMESADIDLAAKEMFTAALTLVTLQRNMADKYFLVDKEPPVTANEGVYTAKKGDNHGDSSGEGTSPFIV